jgi:hypothetical protein
VAVEAEQRDARASAAELLRQRHAHLEEATDEGAESIRAGLQADLERLEADQDLTGLARDRRGDELREQARERMAQLRSGYEQRRRELDLQVRQAAFGTVPSNAAGVTAYRDAVDRAMRIANADEPARSGSATLRCCAGLR